MEKQIVEMLGRIEGLLEAIKDNTEKTASIVDYNYLELSDIKKEITDVKKFLEDNM